MRICTTTGVAAARHVTKMQMRAEALSRLRSNRAQDTELFVGTVTAPAAQTAMGKYLESLKNKSKK
jgi:hypothetical protein